MDEAQPYKEPQIHSNRFPHVQFDWSEQLQVRQEFVAPLSALTDDARLRELGGEHKTDRHLYHDTVSRLCAEAIGIVCY